MKCSRENVVIPLVMMFCIQVELHGVFQRDICHACATDVLGDFVRCLKRLH